MMFVSTRVQASIGVSPLLLTDGNLRRDVGGLAIEAPVPHLPIIPSHLVFFTLSPPSFHPLSPLFTHQAERKASVLHSQAPNLAAGGGSLRLFLRETNLALRLTQ